MNVRAWWSKTGEVLIAMGADEAKRYENAVVSRQAVGQIVDPIEVQLRDQLRAALREAPPGT